MASASTPHSVRIGAAPITPAGSKVVGSLPSATQIQATVTLNPQDPAALASYATDVSTPGSAVYHQYLTVSQFAQRFGATPAQVGAVLSTLRADGLHPGQVARDNLSIPVRGTAAQLASAFSTSFQAVQLRGGRHAFTNTSAPQVPAGVAGIVQGVLGLDNLTLAQPMGQPTPVRARPLSSPNAPAQPNIGGGPQPCSGSSGITQYASTGNTPHTEDQIASAYGFGGLYPGDEGAGQSIAIYELEPFSSSDISTFQTCYSTTTTVTTKVCTACTSPGTGAGSGEAALDIEDVVGLAPKATVLVYEGTNGSADQYNVYAAMVNDNIAKVISTSWGLCETNASFVSSENTLFQQAATQGQSIFAAAGDHGSLDCGGSGSLAVDDPAGQPYVTGVGATNLSAIGPPPTESVWNDYTASNQGQNQDSGGGVSKKWAMPSYQSGAKASLGVINSTSSGTPCGAAAGSYCREVPDVVADGGSQTGYLIYWTNGSSPGWYVFSGTSAAAPTWAAYAALVNASSGCNSTPIGFANPDLYALAGNAWNGSAYTANFHDITVGNNNPANYMTSGLPYSAAAGYDMASGLGSMNGASLTSALCAPKAVGAVTMPSSNSLPTGVVVDRTNHIAYIAESATNTVAKITGTTSAYFLPGAATNVSASALPGLNFPDDLSLDSSQRLYASNFCVGTQVGICSGEASGTTATVTQQTGASAGRGDAVAPCSYASGNAVFTPSSGNEMLFVACAGSGVVNACTTTTGTPLCGTADASIALNKPTGGRTPVPSGVAAIPTETTTPAVIVADVANSTLSIVSWNGTALVAGTPVSLVSGCQPANVAIGPVSGGSAAVYVACPGTGQVEVGTVSSTPSLGSFSATTLPTTGTSTPAPYGVAVNAAGTDLVVSDSANNDVVAYPSLSGTTLGTGTVISAGSTPDGVGLDGANAFVANEASNTVTVVDPPTAPRHHGHYVRARVRANFAHRTISLTPLIAPLPGVGP